MIVVVNFLGGMLFQQAERLHAAGAAEYISPPQLKAGPRGKSAKKKNSTRADQVE